MFVVALLCVQLAVAVSGVPNLHELRNANLRESPSIDYREHEPVNELNLGENNDLDVAQIKDGEEDDGKQKRENFQEWAKSLNTGEERSFENERSLFNADEADENRRAKTSVNEDKNVFAKTHNSANLQKKADTRSVDEVKQLKAQLEEQKKAIEKQKTEMASMMQQIDALVVQQSKTLSLVNKGKSNNGPQVGLQAAKESVTEVITTGGVYYVRWGRNSCPSGVYELYKGYIAGSHYTAASGGSNTLCLHDDPQFGNTGNSGTGNYIYGAEFAFNTPLSLANNNGQSLANQDAVCVVCHTPIRSSQIMIPGRIQCPAGWTFEYKGFIVSNFGHTYTRGDYICLDEAPEAKVGGQSAQYGVFLYPVRPQCGSLSCPKYISARDIVCVVCTK